MELGEARYIAERVVHKLVPVCERVLIAGSIRRQRPDVHDIDICCIPKRKPIKDLFGTIIKHVPIQEFCDQIDSWEKLKGEATGKYTQRLFEGVKVEISICDASTYSIISLIRTGNSDFTHMLMTRALKCGFQQRDGHLWSNEGQIPIHSEEEYFRWLDLPYVPPQLRDANAFRKVKV